MLLTLTPIFVTTSLSLLASPPAGPNLRPDGDVKQMEIVAREVRPETKTIVFGAPHGSWVLRISPRTWIFKDGEEATFADLRDGQRLHVWFTPRGSNAVIIEVLAAKDQDLGRRGEEHSATRNWVTFYYTDPQPDRFVAEVRRRSEAGVLSSSKAAAPMAAFLSRVMAGNPENIAPWMAALADLPEKDLETLHKAIWYSGTDEGNAYLREHGLQKYLAQPAPDILHMPVHPAVLDMLWGYFFATGDAAPIRRIISALNNYQYVGSLERYKTSQKTAEGAKQAFDEIVFRAALWSLGSNCQQHPRVMQICRKLAQDGDLNSTERDCLKAVLDKVTSDSLRNTQPGD